MGVGRKQNTASMASPFVGGGGEWVCSKERRESVC